jgi:RNA polymerase sigma-70 factor (ECF subfamily)
MRAVVDRSQASGPSQTHAASVGSVDPGSPEFKLPEGPRLIRRLAAGDQHALGELYDGYAAFVKAQALRILRDPTQAEAVVEDLFVRVWHEAKNYEPSRESPEAWLTAMARAMALERRRQRLALPETCPAALEDVYSLWNEDTLALRRAVDTLPPDQRRLMSLAYFGGLTLAQIAERLGEPMGTVAERSRTAQLRVRQALTRQRLQRWSVAPMLVHAHLVARLQSEDSLAS